MTTRALVLGGGGITGIAWEIGLLHGLIEAGVDLTGADLVLGTSAGSVVGAQVTNGATTEAMYERQLSPLGTYGPEPASSIGWGVTARWVVLGLRSGRDAEALGRRLGAYAVSEAAAGRVATEEERVAVIRDRLVSQEWPARELRVTAVDADTGAFRTFSREDGVPLARAIAASCAVPGVFAPVTIDGHRYIDGGTRSSSNADLAARYDRVVALTPVAVELPTWRRAASQLSGSDAVHTIIAPDLASRRAIGRNVLDPASRARTARAGRHQGATIARAVSEVWG